MVAHTDDGELVRIISAREVTHGKENLMKKAESEEEDDLRPEYDFSQMTGGVRGKYVQRYYSSGGTSAMWTETKEARQLITEVTKGVVGQAAPEELELFDEMTEQYFQDPTPPKQSDSQGDDALAFGLEQAMVAVTPAVMAMVSAALSHLLKDVIDAAKEESAALIKQKIKALFNRNTPAPLSEKQLEQIKTRAADEGVKFGLSADQAKNMADALVGQLAK